MRIVLYLRMSTSLQETSIDQQRDSLVAYAAKNGHEIVGEYVDEGISGDSTSKRKGFQSMIRDAADGGFDRILCWDQSRFGRFDSIEAGSWITPLRDAGVSLETLDAGVTDWGDFAGRITFAVSQEGKHQFLRDLSRNVVRGLTDKAKAGRGYTGGPTPYGYRRITDFSGRHRLSRLEVDEQTGPIVRRMFEEYAQPGGSCRSVVEFLNVAGISPVRGRVWRRNAVNRILSNRVYCGDHVWGRRNKGRYHSRVGDEIVRRRPGQGTVYVPPIVHENAVPAIVDRGLFDRVQELLIERQKATRRPSTVHPLSGLLTCGRCGKPMHSDSGSYRCSTATGSKAGDRCSRRRVAGAAVLEAVVDGLRANLLSPARLRAVKARLERLVGDQVEEAGRQDTGTLQRRIDDLDRRVAEGVARIPLLPVSLVPELAKELDRLRSQRDDLVRQRAAIEGHREGHTSPSAERVASAIAAAYGLRGALQEAEPAVVNDHLRRLGVRVAVDHEAGTAMVAVDPLAVAGDLNRLGSSCGQVTRKPFLAFAVPLPCGAVRSRSKAG